VFLSSHLLSELALVADHVVVIGRGELIANAPIAELTSDAGRTLEEAYLALTRDAVEYRAGDADGARS
jgi:ABC-2 type transport system ATP-binding protein